MRGTRVLLLISAQVVILGAVAVLAFGPASQTMRDGDSFTPEDPLVPSAQLAFSPSGAAPDPGTRLMPLHPRRLVYRTVDGERFTLTIGRPTAMIWFDATVREVIPVSDSRCNCDVLYRNVDGQIRVVGTVTGGRVEQWGEYIEILPAGASGPAETVETPAGRFEHAVLVQTRGGPAWFAPSVGLIKTERFVLISVEDEPARPVAVRQAS